jgi:GNAT superfamily N-acetyltransferase
MRDETMENEVVSNLQPEAPVHPDKEEVHYRVIADRELVILNPLLEKLGWPALDPDMCKVVVAEAGAGDEALILGFQVVQFVTHAEPMWVHPDLRGSGVAEGLVEATAHYIEQDCHIKRYLCVAKPGSFAARLCEKYGMRAVSGQLYVKQIT